MEEHQRKNVPLKAWLFKCLHILNMTSNSLKNEAPFLCHMFVHIHLSVYNACYFTKTGPNFLSFWWLQNLTVHTNTYTRVIKYCTGQYFCVSRANSHKATNTTKYINVPVLFNNYHSVSMDHEFIIDYHSHHNIRKVSGEINEKNLWMKYPVTISEVSNCAAWPDDGLCYSLQTPCMTCNTAYFSDFDMRHYLLEIFSCVVKFTDQWLILETSKNTNPVKNNFLS